MAYDIGEFKKLIEQIIKLDYEWNKYLVDKRFTCDWIIEEEINARFQYYEECEIDDLVDEAIYDSSYLEAIIDSFLSIKCDNMGIDEKIINQKVVDDYFEKLNKPRVRK